MNPDIIGMVGTTLIIWGVWRLSQHKKVGFLHCAIGDIILGTQGLLLHQLSLILLNVVLLGIHIKGFLNWKDMGL